MDAKKVRKIVDERKSENKPKGSPLDPDQGQDQREEEKRDKNELKRSDEGNINIIEKAIKDKTDRGQG
jgi:hypothetical protein